jgi:Caspase domain
MANAGISRSVYQAVPIQNYNYSRFVNGRHPDSVVLVLSAPIHFFHDAEQTAEVQLDHSSTVLCRQPEGEYFRNPLLNATLVNELIRKGQATVFRCFYRNALAKVYRYEDITVTGKLTREASQNPGADHSITILRYYQSGTTLSRTSYALPSAVPNTRFIRDSLWYDVYPALVKSGQEEVFYSNGVLRIRRWYHDGQLTDSNYTEFNADSTVRTKYTMRNGKLVQTFASGRNYDPRHKALLLGIDHFKSTRIALNGCRNDIEQIRRTLIARRGFDPGNIDTILDKAFTREQVSSRFNKLLAGAKAGDDLFIHFSDESIFGGPDKFVIPCYGYRFPIPDPDSASLDPNEGITLHELEQWLTTIKNKLGPRGQLVVSLDVSHAGMLLSYEDTTQKPGSNQPLASRGESSNVLLTLVRNQAAPVILLTGCSQSEQGYEVRYEDGSMHGLFTFALCTALSDPSVLNTTELFDGINSAIAHNNFGAGTQTPGYLAAETQFLFEPDNSVTDTSSAVASLPEFKAKGSVFSLSIGISDYSSSGKNNLRFANCESDARDYDEFFKAQFHSLPADSGRAYYSSLLLNQQATKENILAAINNAISNSKPDDYFIFNFSGYCKPLRDSTGKQVTWFIPKGLKDISDSSEIRKKAIPLDKLKDLLQLIPANNQLFITEAGPTNNFQKEFIQALIETSPTIASLSGKNRIFIVPNVIGLDQFACNDLMLSHGPVNYYLTHLPQDLNIFGLFEGGVYADAVKFALNKTEVDCNFFRVGYFSIFFEKDFIDNLRYFLPDEVMQTRGAVVVEKDKQAIAKTIGRRYALIVGTDRYAGKPDWPDLNNPVWDAREIARELGGNYGFEVDTLINQPSDSVYAAILSLSTRLQPSDQLLVYVAGHGDFDARLFDDGFIVCANSRPVHDDPYRNSYIQYSKLSRMLNNLRSRQVLMALDVCFGGTFDERVARPLSRSKNETYEDLGADQFIAEKLKKITRLYLTSGGKREVPDGYKGKHSPFAQRMLQALQTKGGKDGILTATQIYQFVTKLPSGPLIGAFGDDEPGSDFILMAKTTPNKP